MEVRVYLIKSGHPVLREKSNTQLTDEEFIEYAEQEGTVYSLKGFQEAFNNIQVDATDDFIRII